MYLRTPVEVPEVNGITYRKKNGSTYVQYELQRKWDPKRKYSSVQRCEIGILIPGKDGLMLPNENYLRYFSGEGAGTGTEKDDMIQAFEAEREHCYMLRDFFEQLYYEFQGMSRRKPNSIVNLNKVRRMNLVLRPLMEMMAGEEYAQFLELIEEPGEGTDENGNPVKTGMSYSDAALLMSQFKGAVSRYFAKIL